MSYVSVGDVNTGYSRVRYRCRARWDRWPSSPVAVVLLVSLTTIVVPPDSINSTITGIGVACAKQPPPPNNSFLSRKLSGRRRRAEEKVAAAAGGLTLGDLDHITNQNKDGISHPELLLGPSAIFGPDSTNSGRQRRQQQYPDRAPAASAEEGDSSQLLPRRSIRRINLDLSGRIMCHVLSPRNQGDAHGHRDGFDGDRESVPLFYIPLKKKQQHQQSGPQQQQQRTTINKLGRTIVPRLYLGANYDLDEVWYGATRWIAKCSWGPPAAAAAASSVPPSSFAATTDTWNNKASPAWESLARQVRHSANQFHQVLFPSFSASSSLLNKGSPPSWILDVEGERSVFENSDSTVRLRCRRSPPPSSSFRTPGAHHGAEERQRQQRATRQQISMEYDSAKYGAGAADASAQNRRTIQHAPTITMDVKTPFLHPRLELHSKNIWIVKAGGDKDGNYYGGDHYGGGGCSSRSSVDRRLEQIRERYREGIPRSSSNPIVSSNSGAQSNRLGSRLSRWLENDGWMPRKVTTNLRGNLVSVNEIGLGGHTIANTDGRGGSDDRAVAPKKNPALLRGIVPPVRNAGMRLRVSKRIDWTALGVYPWSKTHDSANRHQGSAANMIDSLRSTRVRFELCGLHGSEEDRASVGLDVDPLDWSGTLKFVVRHEGVRVLG